MRAVLFAFLALVALPLAPGRAAAAERLFGVATHFGMHGQRPDSIALLAASGANTLRDEVYWSDVEDAGGTLQVPLAADTYVDAALAHGIAPLLVLGYGHPNYDGGDKPRSAGARAGFGRYAAFVVAHFRGRVRCYELWNEWNTAIGGTRAGRADDYVALVDAVLPILRQVDPAARFIAGATTPDGIAQGWLREAVALGLLARVDGLAVHPYNYTVNDGDRPEDWRDGLQLLRGQLRDWRPPGEPRVPPPLYVTETGWPDHVGRHGRSAEQQAAYAARVFLLGATLPELRGLWWYTWQDAGRTPFDPEGRFGLIDRDAQPKPAWHALAVLLPLLRHASDGAPIEMGEAWVARQYFLDDGRSLLAVWRSDDSAGVLQASCSGCSGVNAPLACAARQSGSPGWTLAVDGMPCLLVARHGTWQLVATTDDSRVSRAARDIAGNLGTR